MSIVVFITCANPEEAQKISQALVREKLCACVDSGSEVLLIVKSLKNKFTKIVKLVKSLHSYEVPEIIALPIIAGEKKYLDWLRDSVQ